ncbi:MAG: fibronectin type III domain-containing protein, partial [Microthrixaceae bacterium]
QPAQTFMSTALTQTVTGLTNGQGYTFKVAAINANGTGVQSVATTLFSAIGSPTAPAPASVVAGSLSATVSWTVPTNNGSPITSYNILVGFKGSREVQRLESASPTSTTLTITGLTAGQTYWFAVIAINTNGASPWAVASAL